ncbi:MAG TPA: glycosyltransferase family 4 protein [Pyrinomonadaceae bacterium]|jgi:glycosyltransferase involved in cell wall biosynthesis
MKILHFLDTVNRGGAETLVLDVCRNAEKNGLNIMFAAAGGGALEKDFMQSGVEYHRFKRRFPFDLSLVASLRSIIKKNEIRIVHTHQAVEALHALAAAVGTKTKVVLTHHGIVPDKKNLLALKFVMPRVAHNIAVGHASKKSYETELNLKFPPATSVVYNGVDELRLKPTGKDLRAELNLSKDIFLIGMVGNFYFEPRKDQMTLCRALPRIFNEMPNVHCVFAGRIENGAEEKLAECVRFCRENNIADRVHFLGARSDVPDILAALDVFVCSSLKEGLPIAVNEAMLAGVPTIVSDIEPLLEASDKGKYAEIFPVGKPKALSKNILDLLRDEHLRKNLSNRAFVFARNNFSIEAHLAELKKLYQSLIES